MQTLSEVRVQADPHLPGWGTKGVPWVAKGFPAREGQPEDRAEFRLKNTDVVCGRCPGKHREQRGAAQVGGKGKEGGGGKADFPLRDKQKPRERAGQPRAAGASDCGAGSRRLPGAPQRPPHRPLGPQGPRTSAAKALGPDIHGIGPSSPGDPGGNTPTPVHLSAGQKRSLHFVPSVFFPSPEAAEKVITGKKPEASRDSGSQVLDLLPRLPVRTPTRIWWSIVRIIPRRHVSQRSHRTDRSREKPEPGARGPGALALRARERERPGSASRAGKEGEAAECPRPARVRGRVLSARVRGGWGAESGRGTPTSGRRRRAAGERWLPRETARRRWSEAAETQPCGARDPALGRQETKGKGEHKLPRLRGWTRARGGATPRIVELVGE